MTWQMLFCLYFDMELPFVQDEVSNLRKITAPVFYTIFCDLLLCARYFLR